MDKHIIEVQDNNGVRLDVFLSEELDLTRSNIKQLIDNKNVFVNSLIVKAGKILKKGDIIQVTIPDEIIDLVPENIPLDILYEDNDIAVINKQQGLTVHPGGGANSGTLANALMFHFNSLSNIGGAIRPGIVHRLDKDTSGVMVVAKNDATHLDLSRQIAEREVDKIYIAIVEGVIKDEANTIITFIDRSPRDRKLMAVAADGKEAITKYKVIERFKQNSLVEFIILTGRTHQIRVHAKHIGHPVVGDSAYGYKKQRFNLMGQLLHAKTLAFYHPVTKQRMSFSAPIPNHFEKVLAVLKKETIDEV